MKKPEFLHSVIDFEREKRQGVSEIIYAEHKSPQQVKEIAAALAKQRQNVFATRATHEQYLAVKEVLPEANFDELGRVISYVVKSDTPEQLGSIAVICAGTSDLPIAQEAALTAEFLGGDVLRISDVGVAGLHRLLSRIDEIRPL